jgi:hypothetical protein
MTRSARPVSRGKALTYHHLVERRQGRFYFTLMNEVCGLGVTDFGQNLTGARSRRSTVSAATRSRLRSTLGVFLRLTRARVISHDARRLPANLSP